MPTPMHEAPAAPRAAPLNTVRANPELFAALAEAQADAQAVDKDGRNTQRNYAYATAESMIAEAKRALAGHGLSVLHSWEVLDPTERATAGDIGNQFVCGTIVIHWVLAHSSGGVIQGTCSMDAIAGRARPHDKAVAADLTYAWGFVLRGLLNLARGEDSNAPDARQETGAPEPSPERLRWSEADGRFREAIKIYCRAHPSQTQAWRSALIERGQKWLASQRQPTTADLERATVALGAMLHDEPAPHPDSIGDDARDEQP